MNYYIAPGYYGCFASKVIKTVAVVNNETDEMVSIHKNMEAARSYYKGKIEWPLSIVSIKLKPEGVGAKQFCK